MLKDDVLHEKSHISDLFLFVLKNLFWPFNMSEMGLNMMLCAYVLELYIFRKYYEGKTICVGIIYRHGQQGPSSSRYPDIVLTRFHKKFNNVERKNRISS